MTSPTWYDRVPLELHGHRKKLDYVIRAVDGLRAASARAADDIGIVEIGCSNGRILSLPLAERGYRVTGVDLHQPSIDLANSDNTFANARFVCRDAAEFVTVETFDVVILSDILEHVHDPLALLNLAVSLLRPKGIVLICIPNGYGPAELERRFSERTGIGWGLAKLRAGINRVLGRQVAAYNNDSGHVQAFRMRDIEQLLRQAGLSLDDRQRGALFGGAITYPVGRLLPGLVRMSLRWADSQPFERVSTWYFRCSREK